MSSRVQKGNTVFRPVVKARSRAPTANSALTSLALPNFPPISETSPGIHHPIPSTAVPGREAPKQGVPQLQRHEPISVVFQRPPNVVQDPPITTRGTNAPSIITSPTPSILANASAITVGRSLDQANAITLPSQEIRHPVSVSYPLQIPGSVASVVQTGPSQQSTVILAPLGPPQLGITNSPQAAALENDLQAQTSSAAWSASHRQQEGERLQRKRTLSTTISDNETEEGNLAKKPKSRSITPRQRRSRGPSLPPYDSNADPGEDIDPTIVTMATLCNDTGQGRVSSKAAEILNNHAAWKVKNRERRARMRSLMEAKKYGRSADEDADQPENPASSLSETENRSSNAVGPSVGPNTAGGDDENFDYTQQMETSRYNVQVRIGPGGETIIDEDSLVVDRTETEDMSSYTHVVESDHTKFVNSGTYGKRYRGSRWSAEETELFYHALSQYGENYELIAYVLPGRDRKSCKNKFKAEDKKNHARINECLNKRIPVDMKTLERMTGRDFSGPVPQIRAPPPPPPPTVQHESTGENTESSNPQTTPSKQVKKRSRSRTTGLEDGVIIVGDVDSVLS